VKTIAQSTALRTSSRPSARAGVFRALTKAGDIIVRCDLDPQHITRCGYFAAGLMMWRVDLGGLDAEEIASPIAGERSA